MTPDLLLDVVREGLLLADRLYQTDPAWNAHYPYATPAPRPEGLSASRIGFCRSQAVRILAGHPPGEDGNRFPGMRGRWMHEQLRRDLEPLFAPAWKFEERVWWHPAGLPPLSGQYDFLGQDQDGLFVGDWKTKPKAECHSRSRLGPSENECMQVAVLAAATSASQGFIVWVPTDGGWDDWTCSTVDVPYWTAQAGHWYQQVADHTTESPDEAPRDVPYGLCAAMCPFFGDCRTGFIDLHDIFPSYLALAARQLGDARVRYRAAARDVRAYQEVLGNAEGLVPPLAEGEQWMRAVRRKAGAEGGWTDVMPLDDGKTRGGAA